MVYLGIVGLCAISALLWKLSHRPDPHHIFIISLLPLLDTDHSVGSDSELGEQALRRDSHTRAVA